MEPFKIMAVAAAVVEAVENRRDFPFVPLVLLEQYDNAKAIIEELENGKRSAGESGGRSARNGAR